MSDETTLLPCPFCGGEARLVNDYSSEKGMSYQIWHECTGHEGRSGGYGQGVKPFFETPWYATDAEAIAAWNTRTHGTLKAEQVKRIHEIIEKHWHDLPAEYDIPEATALPEYSYDWQAIADELNAKLGSGTCEVVKGDGEKAGWWVCKSCGCAFDMIGALACNASKKPRFCPNCCAKVVG